jgi:hypothetical protein
MQWKERHKMVSQKQKLEWVKDRLALVNEALKELV